MRFLTPALRGGFGINKADKEKEGKSKKNPKLETPEYQLRVSCVS